jgi:hypothetical protein
MPSQGSASAWGGTTIMKTRYVPFALFVVSASIVHAADYFLPSDTSGGWRAATNAAQVRELAGIDLARLEQAWEFTQRCTQNAGLIVVRNGWLVFEKYVGRARHHVAGVPRQDS